jgi:predicted acyltransferase
MRRESIDTAEAWMVPAAVKRWRSTALREMMDDMPTDPLPELTERTIARTIAGPPRVLSVDLLRGLTMAFMILVNDPGDWGHVFEPLDHSPWNGWTITDLIFPTFLFLVGTSLIFSLESRAAKGDCRKTLSGHVVLRTVKILVLQYLIVYFPAMDWRGMRLYGVLPRIALCYLLAGLVLIATLRMKTLKSRVMVLAAVSAALLIGYWGLLRWVPVPGIGMPGRDIPFMDKNANLTSWIDRGVMAWTQHWLHTGTLYLKTRDPEGLLSTLPAVATVLLGSLAGIWMRRPAGTRGGGPLRRMQLLLAAAGLLGVLAGELWSMSFPINKNLWTSSYVLLAAGWAALALAVLSWVVDRRPEPWPRWLRIATWPWFVFGSNAIAAYTASAVLIKTLLYWKPGGGMSMLGLIYSKVFARGNSTEWTSLAFAVCFVAACFLPVWFLWTKRWFLKI